MGVISKNRTAANWGVQYMDAQVII